MDKKELQAFSSDLKIVVKALRRADANTTPGGPVKGDMQQKNSDYAILKGDDALGSRRPGLAQLADEFAAFCLRADQALERRDTTLPEPPQNFTALLTLASAELKIYKMSIDKGITPSADVIQAYKAFDLINTRLLRDNRFKPESPRERF